jgi:hypothetical protein
MTSWKIAQNLAAELAKDNDLSNAESWLTEEVLYLLNVSAQ